MKALIALALASAAVVSNAALYDLAADFTIDNGNPNGPWSYGYRQGLSGSRVDFVTTIDNYVGRDWWTATGFSSFNIPSVFKQHTGNLEGLNLGEVGFHPGPTGQYASILFTAPESGDLTLDSAMRSGQGTRVDLHVRVNGVPVYNALAVTDARSFDLTTPVSVTAGSTVELLVGASTDGDAFDTTPVSARINIAQPVPEPASLAGLALGGLALLRRRARRN